MVYFLRTTQVGERTTRLLEELQVVKEGFSVGGGCPQKQESNKMYFPNNFHFRRWERINLVGESTWTQQEQWIKEIYIKIYKTFFKYSFSIRFFKIYLSTFKNATSRPGYLFHYSKRSSILLWRQFSLEVSQSSWYFPSPLLLKPCSQGTLAGAEIVVERSAPAEAVQTSCQFSSLSEPY